MSDTKYLTQRDGLWLFRRRVPEDCRKVFNGKTFVTKSLETHNIREARLRRNQMVAEMDLIIQDHRHGNSIVSDTQHYRSLISDYMSASQGGIEAEYHRLTETLEKLSKGRDIEPDFSSLAHKLPSMSKEERETAYREETLKSYIELIPDPEERLKAKALQNAYLGIQHDLVHISLNDALKMHLEDNGERLKVNTQTTFKTAVRRFLETIDKPDIPLQEIGRLMVKTFIKAQLAQRSGSTVATYVTFLSSIFKSAADVELVNTSNPFTGHRIDTAPKDSYQLFEAEELTAIFKRTKKYKTHKENYKYILPRLGYVTGCRIEELCSLTCEQIVTDDDTDITYFEVLVGKTDNAKRKIPIHSWIVDDVLKQKDKVKEGILFPLLTTQRNDGRRSDKVSKWFGRLRDEVRTQKGKKGFHSFRVHMATNLERGDVLESTAVWILGHTRNLSLSYGLYSKGKDIEDLLEAINVIPIDKGWV